MRRLLRYILPVLAAAFLLPSCMVHEFPEGNVDVNVQIRLEFPPEMTPYKTVTKADEVFHQLRYLVRVFEYSGDAWDRNAKEEITLFSSDFINLDRTVEVMLPAGKYRFAVWVDYTDLTGGNLFWNADNMDKVTFYSPYPGDSRYREAFCGREIVDFSDYNASGLVKEVVIPMTRPLAAYELVANDKEEFITKFFAKVGDASRDGTKSTYDLSGYSVRIDYQYFFPTVYDVRRDINVDSRTGMYFTVPVFERDGEVVMGHDFVLAPEEETRVVVDMTLFDNDGIDLGTVSGISIPLVRGGVTTVRGTLLTSGSTSGVRIDTEFEGDINIKL